MRAGEPTEGRLQCVMVDLLEHKAGHRDKYSALSVEGSVSVICTWTRLVQI